MDEQRYDIYFTGKLIAGVTEAQAQQNLAALFNTRVEKVTRLFNGKAQLLKRGMDKTATIKYKAAFEGAGLVVAFKKLPLTTPAPATSTTPAASPTATTPAPAREQSASSAQQVDADASLTIAPVGSDVLREDERRQVPAVDIDTSNIKLVSAFMEPETTAAASVAAPDTSHISVAEVGADILAEKPPAPAPLELDIDAITLAEVGSDLEQLRSELPPVDPDTSAITLAEVGADVLAEKPPAPKPVVPDISHLAIDDSDSSGR